LFQRHVERLLSPAGSCGPFCISSACVPHPLHRRGRLRQWYRGLQHYKAWSPTVNKRRSVTSSPEDVARIIIALIWNL
jgi:hypothetical protein